MIFDKFSDSRQIFRFLTNFQSFNKVEKFSAFGKTNLGFQQKFQISGKNFRFHNFFHIIGKFSDFSFSENFQISMTMTFREHPQRAILETCDLSDI